MPFTGIALLCVKDLLTELGWRGKEKGSHLLLSEPIKTDKGVGMEESYDEGLANHIGPESCVDNGNIISEALTGESGPMNRDVPQAGDGFVW